MIKTQFEAKKSAIQASAAPTSNVPVGTASPEKGPTPANQEVNGATAESINQVEALSPRKKESVAKSADSKSPKPKQTDLKNFFKKEGQSKDDKENLLFDVNT